MDPPLAKLYTQLACFLISLFSCFLFSFLETSLTALRLFKLKEMAEKAQSQKKFFRILEKYPTKVLTAILIASNAANAVTSAIASRLMEDLFSRLGLSGGLGFWIGIFLATVSIIIFGEVIPKNIAKTQGEGLLRSTVWIANGLLHLLYPFVALLNRLSQKVMALLGAPTGDSNEISEKEIKFLIDYIRAKGLMDPEKTEMLQNIFELGATPVKEIMIPETDVVTISVNSTVKDAAKIFNQYRFSRLPVYTGKHTNIVGMIHQKDVFTVLATQGDASLSSLVREVLFVPESVRINQLLREFKQKRMQMAMVLNEFGSVSGLVTLEDVLEEIVGDISDEYEETPEKAVELDNGQWLIDASLELSKLNKLFGLDIDSETAVTLGGFLTEQLQHVPKKGEEVNYNGKCFHIQKANGKRVLKVLVYDGECNPGEIKSKETN